jgi:hypothetical protein
MRMKTQPQIVFAAAFVLLTMATACSNSEYKNSTPTEAAQTFFQAVKNNDAAAIKKVLPKKIVEKIERDAKESGQSEDILFKRILMLMGAGSGLDKIPEMREEKIDGDRATVEAKDEKSGSWKRVPLIKESDGWKANF